MEDTFEAPSLPRGPSATLRTNLLRPREMPAPLRVVVTGYGDFAGTWNAAEGRPNPSSVLARQLAELGVTNAVVEYRHLEVTHAAVEAFIQEMEAEPPDIILSMGVSSKAQVELKPQNWTSPSLDGRGEPIQDGVIDPRRTKGERIVSELPNALIEAALRRAVAEGVLSQRTVATDDPARFGPDEDYRPDDSGYLCNYLNYRLTDTFGDADAVTAGFVHVTPETSAEEIRVIVQSLVDRQQSSREVAEILP